VTDPASARTTRLLGIERRQVHDVEAGLQQVGMDGVV
jgi:hypothetical protein